LPAQTEPKYLNKNLPTRYQSRPKTNATTYSQNWVNYGQLCKSLAISAICTFRVSFQF